MKILHISNDYAGSKVHSLLTANLDQMGIEQAVYCPVRSISDMGKNQFIGNHISFVYSFVIRPCYKFVYHYKAHKLYKDLKLKVNLANFDLIHAPSLFSDGALAYKAYREFNTPYVVAVRSTDTYDFIKRGMLHTFSMGRKILLNASKIYFISAEGKKQLENSFFAKPVIDRIKGKFVLRPNGIEDVWLKNISLEHHSSHKVCYVGTFLARKNIPRVIEAIDILRHQRGYEDVSIRIIGGGWDEHDTVKRLIDNNPSFVEYLGKISDKQELMKKMRECGVFAMPSWNETFGLVYIEALSQGLPVVYTKNDGIDGFFDDTVGIAVNHESIKEIMLAIKSILDNPTRYGNKNINFQNFNWHDIACKYLSDYKQIING